MTCWSTVLKFKTLTRPCSVPPFSFAPSHCTFRFWLCFSTNRTVHQLLSYFPVRTFSIFHSLTPHPHPLPCTSPAAVSCQSSLHPLHLPLPLCSSHKWPRHRHLWDPTSNSAKRWCNHTQKYVHPPPINLPTFFFSARTYIHHPFFGLGCCLLHASFGLLCCGHHPFLSHGEPLHQYIHLERLDGWTPLLQTGRPGWCLRWMCRRDDVRVCVSVWVWVCVCACVLLVAPLPIAGSTEGWEDCTTGLQHADWGTEGGENSNYARDGEEEEEEDAAAFSSHAATPPLKHPSTLIHLSPDDAHSCSAQPLACCLHIVIGVMLSLWALLHNEEAFLFHIIQYALWEFFM